MTCSLILDGHVEDISSLCFIILSQPLTTVESALVGLSCDQIFSYSNFSSIYSALENEKIKPDLLVLWKTGRGGVEEFGLNNVDV